MPKRVIMFSSGAGSWAAAKRVADKHGTEDLFLVFADVLGEDQDNYRFMVEAAADIYGVTLPASWRELVPTADVQSVVDVKALRELAAEFLPQFVWLVEGRTIWQVFEDNRFLGNSRLANCSKFLKQKPCRDWLNENCKPKDTTVYLGIDWMEEHRQPAIVKSYFPYAVEFPMSFSPYVDKEQVLAQLRATGIEPPRLYKMGFAHANCGGGCVRAGQGQFAHLLTVMPERYAAWEANEAHMRTVLDRDVAILREQKKGVKTPLTLLTLRERAESSGQIDLFDIGGCGCFVEEESPA